MQLADFTEVDEVQSPKQSFDDIIQQVEDNINGTAPDGKVDLDYKEFKQFKKSWFYHNWHRRFRRLGSVGVIAIPNTTLEEWIYWLYEWSQTMTDDYNQFKKLVYEAIKLHEEHLKLLDSQVKDLQDRVTEIERQLVEIWKKIGDLTNDITNLRNDLNNLGDRVTKNEQDIADLKNQFAQFKANIFNVQYTSMQEGTLQNNWYMRDDKDRAFGIWWGWNNNDDHSQGVHWIPLLNYLYHDNATFDAILANDGLIGTVPQPPELIEAGFRIYETWMYAGYTIQSAPLVGTPFIHIVPVGDNLEVRILNTSRAGTLPENLGTVQLNAGGTPTQYIS